jgi:hypothetical protein
MARTQLTPQVVDRDGVIITEVAGDATNDHSFENLDEDVLLYVRNGGTGAVQVTVDVPLSVDGLAVPDLSVSVASGNTVLMGPFPKRVYNQEDAGNSVDEAVLVNLDQDDTVYIAALQI